MTGESEYFRGACSFFLSLNENLVVISSQSFDNLLIVLVTFDRSWVAGIDHVSSVVSALFSHSFPNISYFFEAFKRRSFLRTLESSAAYLSIAL